MVLQSELKVCQTFRAGRGSERQVCRDQRGFAPLSDHRLGSWHIWLCDFCALVELRCALRGRYLAERKAREEIKIRNDLMRQKKAWPRT